ncbi:hypothetical protein QQ045_002148 [Rhodiola kirilowii]
MAASSHGNPISTTPSSPSVNSSPPEISLTSDQVGFCMEALQSFRMKLRKPEQILKEFAYLEANRLKSYEVKRICSVALNKVNQSKNRYTDIVPWTTDQKQEAISMQVLSWLESFPCVILRESIPFHSYTRTTAEYI